jgi:TonB family protein
MTNNKKVTLEFACPEKLDDKLFCEKCAHHLVDFRGCTPEEIQDTVNKTDGRVCGIFKKSQLSDQFLKYAAATFIASSLPTPNHAQDSTKYELSTDWGNFKLNNTDLEFQWTLGFVVDTQAEPVGGYLEFLDAIQARMYFPKGVLDRGQIFVEFVVDTEGRMKDVKILKGIHPVADKEVLRAVGSLEFPFTPGKQKGVPTETRLVIPILFDPLKRRSVTADPRTDDALPEA